MEPHQSRTQFFAQAVGHLYQGELKDILNHLEAQRLAVKKQAFLMAAGIGGGAFAFFLLARLLGSGGIGFLLTTGLVGGILW